MARDVIVWYGLELIRDFLIHRTVFQPDLWLHLYVQPIAFTINTTLADIFECTAPGYADVQLPIFFWSQFRSGNTAVGQQSSNIVFTFSGPGSPAQTIYGHYYSDGEFGDVIWGQAWSTPYPIPGGGGTVSLGPEVDVNQCP